MINLSDILNKETRAKKRNISRPQFQQVTQNPLVGAKVPMNSNGTLDLEQLLCRPNKKRTIEKTVQLDHSSETLSTQADQLASDSKKNEIECFTEKGWPILERLPRTFSSRKEVEKWCEIPKELIDIDPQVLKNRNGHDLFPGITFLEGPHQYWLDDEQYTKLCKLQGKQVVPKPGQWNRHCFSKSVTAIAARCFSPFDAEKAIDGIVCSKNYSNPDYEYYKMTRAEISNKWYAANLLGTMLHYLIELFYNGYGDRIENCLKDVSWRQFQRFHREQVVGKMMPYLTELRVYDLEYDVAGSIDGVFVRIQEYQKALREKRRPKIILMDWKRTSKLSKSSFKGLTASPPLNMFPDSNFYKYSMQLNLYKYLIERNAGYHVEAMYLCRFNPNLGDDYELIKVEIYEEQVKQLFALRKAELALANKQ